MVLWCCGAVVLLRCYAVFCVVLHADTGVPLLLFPSFFLRYHEIHYIHITGLKAAPALTDVIGYRINHYNISHITY